MTLYGDCSYIIPWEGVCFQSILNNLSCHALIILNEGKGELPYLLNETGPSSQIGVTVSFSQKSKVYVPYS